MPVVIRVRAPTAAAWLSLAAAVILSGELLYALRADGRVSLLGLELSSSQAWPLQLLLGGAVVTAVAWLASLYLRPGALVVDGEGGLLRRERSSWLRRRVVESPPDAWKVRVVYFSDRDRAERRFKRLEVDAPGLSEVLLFTDVADAPALVRRLEQLADRLGAFEEHVENAG